MLTPVGRSQGLPVARTLGVPQHSDDGGSLLPHGCAGPNPLFIISCEFAESYVERVLKQWPKREEACHADTHCPPWEEVSDIHAKALRSVTKCDLLWKQRRVIFPTDMCPKSRIS